MIRFYCPDIEREPTLPESDSAHAVRVLRMREGQPLQVVDGKGHLFDCILTGAHQKHASVEIVARHDQPLAWPCDITVAVAPTKLMDRMEWLVEKLTEVGVNRIVPMLCERSERREIKRERLEKVAVAAMKQSLKSVLPAIEPMTPLGRVLEMAPQFRQKFVGYCSDIVPRNELARAAQPGADTLLMIGPEGDFTPGEIEKAMQAGVVPVTIGPNRLRTETAALVGVTALHVLAQLHGLEGS